MTTEIGAVEVTMPRDRNATFDPKLVPKGERRLDGLSGQIISLYAKGLTTGEIRDHLEEIYDTSISKDTISRITDAIVEDMEAWQSRPLDADLPGGVDRRDRDQGPRHPSREPARLRGDRREPRR